jgi:hypothetical protein
MSPGFAPTLSFTSDSRLGAVRAVELDVDDVAAIRMGDWRNYSLMEGLEFKTKVSRYTRTVSRGESALVSSQPH